MKQITLQQKSIYFFTGYSIVQLIGYLGTAYTWLSQPMLIIVLFLILYCLLLSISEWVKSQNREIAGLSKHRVLASFAGGFSAIFVIMSIILVGVWIAS